MDWSKYPLEKLFYFVAGVVPGFAALLIFQLHNPGSFGWFFALGFLGYKTKIAIVVLVAFLVGNSITTILSSLLGAIGGVVGYLSVRGPLKWPTISDVAPWRDQRWRNLVKAHLGTRAPKDTTLISKGMIDVRYKLAVTLSQEQQPTALAALSAEVLSTAMEDKEWERWYEHYHQIVLEPDDRDFVLPIRTGFNFNLEVTALYVAASAFWVPALRHWWYLVPACLWLMVMLAEVYESFRKYLDKWSTLSAQIKYLSEDQPGLATSSVAV